MRIEQDDDSTTGYSMYPAKIFKGNDEVADMTVEFTGAASTSVNALDGNTYQGVHMDFSGTTGRLLDTSASEVSIVIGNKVKRGKAYLCYKDENKRNMETLFYGNRRNRVVQEQEDGQNIQVPSKRDDGWMEIEIGEFFSSECDEEIEMSVMEVGHQLKGGLVLEGIEVRPKT
jgi:hypothetical protein